MIDILVPEEQEGTKAVVRAWLKQVGDRVEENDPLVELETDKVAMEVPAPAAGVLREILLRHGCRGGAGRGARADRGVLAKKRRPRRNRNPFVPSEVEAALARLLRSAPRLRSGRTRPSARRVCRRR